jgi:hypothetical protein
LLHLQQICSKRSRLSCRSPNPRLGSIRISNTSRFLLDNASLFSLFLQEIISGGRSFAAEILDLGRPGERNNSGTNSSRRLTKSK